MMGNVVFDGYIMFKSTGKIIYKENPYNVIVLIDKEICRYYRSLLPKYFFIRPQMYDPHISVVRKKIPRNLTLWKKHENEIVEFTYSHEIQTDGKYYWLSVWSDPLNQIRTELDVDISDYRDKILFHITIGNCK